jgi:DNA helicase IV
VERDVEVRALGKQLNRLNVADHGLCFGRLDSLSGERLYIGRIGLFDEQNDYEPLLLDWRAPAARAFYVATAASPENMRRRRQFHTRGRRVVDFTDEVFGRPGDGQSGDAALLAAVNAPRGEGMRDIVATIQAQQDEIIRLDHSGVLVIEGGPGTGKTVVALHRVAYLLYTQRERIERHGVLVVGPNTAFLNHIGRVLPSLGETNVVFMTTGDLVPGLRIITEDTAEAARLKGSLRSWRCLRRRSPIGSGCRKIRCRSNCRMSRCGSTPRPRSGPSRRRARVGTRTTRPAPCSARSSPTCSPSERSRGSALAG